MSNKQYETQSSADISRSSESSGTHLAPKRLEQDIDMRDFSGLGKADSGKEPTLPRVELSDNGGRFFRTTHQFAQSVSDNFSRFDLNSDQRISKVELDARLSAPKDHLSATAQTLNAHFDELRQTLKADGPGLSRDDASKLLHITSAETCDSAPSLGRIVSRGMAGGAIGGGITAKAQGESFREGAGKGAAVGAAVGVIAYGIQEADYKSLVAMRNTIDSWNEIEAKACAPEGGRNEVYNGRISESVGAGQSSRSADAVGDQPRLAPTSPEIRTRANMKLVSDTVEKMKQDTKPALSEQELITKLQNFTKQIPALDSNHDGYLSVDELADGVRGNKLAPAEKQTAAVIAQNIEIMSQLNATGEHNGIRINAADLATAHSIYEKPGSGQVISRNVYVGVNATIGGVFGCIGGGVIGMLGGPPGMIAGCAIGGAIGGGGTGLIVSRTTPRPDPLGEKLGREPVKQLRADLSLLR